MNNILKKLIILNLFLTSSLGFTQENTPPPENAWQINNMDDYDQAISELSEIIKSIQSDINKECGIKLFFDYYATLLSNPSGGYKHSSTYNQEIIYGFEFNLEEILEWKGASFVVSGAYASGADLKNSTGSFFSPSQVALTDGAAFYQLFLRQEFELNLGSIEIQMGRFAVGDDFCTLPAYGVLASGAMDANPAAIFANSPFTGSPTATWSISIAYDTGVEDISFSAALVQVPADILSSKWDGLNFKISSDDGYFAIFEMQWKPSFYQEYDSNGNGIEDSALVGNYNLGGYFFGGYNPNEIEGYNKDSAYGFYIQGQQMLYRWGKDSYISMWAGMQLAPVDTVCPVTWMAFSGLQIQGFIPERINDGLFISYYAAFFSDKYQTESGRKATSEMGIEVTYVFQLSKNIALQPDIQYILRPNGDSSVDDALIIGGQIAISF